MITMNRCVRIINDRNKCARCCAAATGAHAILNVLLSIMMVCLACPRPAHAQTTVPATPNPPATTKPPADKPTAGKPESDSPETAPPASEPADEQEQTKLPMLSEMELPSYAKLLKGPPIDWVVLKTEKVIEVEPIYPRPGALEAIQKRISDSLKRGIGPALPEDTKRQRLKLYYLPLTLLDGEEREFKLHVQFIRQITYYEDLMLRRMDALIDERHIHEAFELMLALESRNPAWPGIADRQERLLFTEAAMKIEAKQLEPALALLEELHDRNRNYQGISAQLGRAIDELISDAVKQQDFRRARFFLNRLKKRLGKAPAVVQWTATLQADAQEAISTAIRFEQQGHAEKALNAIERAAQIWPDAAELTAPFGRIEKRYQRLRVGVLELPQADSNVEFPSEADRRQRQLTQTTVFQPARIDGKVVRYKTRFFEEWEPEDLGHSLRVRLRQHYAPWESLSAPTAGAIAASLARRMDPHGPEGDERFASYVDSMTIVSPFELVINFRQVPLRPEALFGFSLQNEAQPFHAATRSEGQVVYRRTIPERASAFDSHVAEIVEVKFESQERALQALFRGEISMLPRVPVSIVSKFENRPDFFTYPFAVPTTHLLQFNPHSRALANRTLRRALVYALDRRSLLEQTFLHEPPGRLGRTTSAPFPTTSNAYNPLVEPHAFDPVLAFSLAVAAKKEIGGKLPPMTLLCPADVEMQAAARKITEQWRRIGMEVAVKVQTRAATAAAADWDILYTANSMIEPLVELWRCVTLTGKTDVNSLTRLPVWLRHGLLELDQVEDWNAAQELLHKLHRQLWAEAYMIPLWELNEFMVTRRNVRGAPERPLHAYDGIERWTVDPWYPKDY